MEQPEDTDERCALGKRMMEQIYYSMALYIIETAKDVYKLSDEQVRALKDVFARPNDYHVVFRPD